MQQYSLVLRMCFLWGCLSGARSAKKMWRYSEYVPRAQAGCLERGVVATILRTHGPKPYTLNPVLCQVSTRAPQQILQGPAWGEVGTAPTQQRLEFRSLGSWVKVLGFWVLGLGPRGYV